MQTPASLAAPPDLQVSEAATPGASVAAVRGGDDHMLETPEFDTPGQASPARHRSQEGGRSLGDGAAALDSSRNRSGGLHAAAVAALAEAVAAPAAAAEPLSKPRLRVQGADIILEDAASPKDAAENGGGSAQRPPQDQPQLAAAAAGVPAQAPVAAAGNAGAGTSAAAQQPAALAGQPPQQQNTQPPPLNLAAMRVSQAHEHELQLRLASRTATGVSNMAIASTRALVTHPLPHGDDRCGELLMGRQGRLQSWESIGGCAFASASPCCLQSTQTFSSAVWLRHRACSRPSFPSTLLLTPPTCHPSYPCSRLRGHDAGGGGEAGPASGGSSAVEGPVRIKYRSTLTEENVAYLNKLDQYASRPDTTGRSSGAGGTTAGGLLGGRLITAHVRTSG